MFYFRRGATAALVPGFLCQSGRRRPENVSILSSLLSSPPLPLSPGEVAPQFSTYILVLLDTTACF